MQPDSQIRSAAADPGAAPALLAHFPAEVADAFRRVQGGDLAAVDPLVLAAVREHVPEPARARTAHITAETALVADLGYDSMAISELVFFFEDLFQVSIANEEIGAVRTVGDLGAFVRRKLGSVR